MIRDIAFAVAALISPSGGGGGGRVNLAEPPHPFLEMNVRRRHPPRVVRFHDYVSFLRLI